MCTYHFGFRKGHLRDCDSVRHSVLLLLYVIKNSWPSGRRLVCVLKGLIDRAMPGAVLVQESSPPRPLPSPVQGRDNQDAETGELFRH